MNNLRNLPTSPGRVPSDASTAGSQILTGSFTKADGTTATLADLNFTQDNFHSEYVDHVEIPEALREAAADGYELCFEGRMA